MDKRQYVRDRIGSDDGDHTCHWPGCDKRVPAALWGCRRHWMKLPKHLRDQIWRTFRPGQEEDKSPSADYLAVATKVREWIRENHPEQHKLL